MSSEKKGKSDVSAKKSVNDEVLHFKDDSVVMLTNEFDQVRQCLGMYIGVGETEGAMHLLNETVTNSMDEGINEECVARGIGDTIELYFDEKECLFTVIDNGRGIPLEMLPDMVQKKHASTKIGRADNRYSGGQNGVGMTCTAALSSRFEMRCWRYGKSRAVHVSGDKLIDDGYTDAKPSKHGSMTVFSPSKRWIGEFHITCADVEDYLRRLSYILPDRMKVKYLGTDEKGHSHSIVYKPQGICANVEYLSQALDFPPVYLTIPETRIEFEDREDFFFKMELAFSYDRGFDDLCTASFCNTISTKDGGYHETVLTRAIAEFFTKQAKELDPNHKFEVTQEDCKRGLVFAVNCDCSEPKFEGQHKSRVGQKDLVKYARKPILDALEVYFNTNNGLLRRIVSYLHQVAKARLEVNKIKKSTLKRPSSFLDDAAMKNFSNISDRNYTGYKELILAEGDSAISAVSSARNIKCQAIYAVTGVVPNTYGMTTANVMQKHQMFRELVQILGCGVGADFDISKLKWDAVIIATDKDVDGDNITSLLSAFFACHMPGIVTAGRLYKVVPPLYRINTKNIKKYYSGRDYLFDKAEYYSLRHRIVAENMEIATVEPTTPKDLVTGHGTVRQLNKKERIMFLDQSIRYLPELNGLVKRSSCSRDVLEYVCYYYLQTRHAKDPDKEFGNLISKKFPEISYDPDLESIYGSYEGNNVSLIIDKIFFKMASRMFRCIDEAPTFYLLCKGKKDAKNVDPSPNDWDLMSLGQFLAMCDIVYNVDIEQRYKGLGESDAIMIFPSMMNPKTRKLLRITMDDRNRVIENLRYLHGDGADMREARRKMLKEADITLEDIDN